MSDKLWDHEIPVHTVPVYKYGDTVIVEVPMHNPPRIIATVVGKSTRDFDPNPMYIVECKDDTFPNEVYPWKCWVCPIDMIRRKEG